MTQAEARTAAVIGTGLIGTSLGLALRHAGCPVRLVDPDAASLRLAAQLGAGEPAALSQAVASADVAFVCVPPHLTVDVVRRALAADDVVVVSDTASVKVPISDQIADARFVPGHPLAGRERSGAKAARGDLFVGRPWVLTPSATTSAAAVDAVRRVLESISADVATMDAPEHDAAMALVSHLPQTVASALAARLVTADERAMAVTGPGLVDTTRLAASDAQLWTEILTANADRVVPVLRALADDLAAVADALHDGADDAGRGVVADLLARGNQGRARLPGKHGRPPATYGWVPVVVPDRPGALAELFQAAQQASVNVEDVAIEHSPGQPVGLVELAVAPESVALLTAALDAAGFSVH